MTDEAAAGRGPATPGSETPSTPPSPPTAAGQSDEPTETIPPAWTPPTATAADEPLPPPPSGENPPAGGNPPPPWFGTGDEGGPKFDREQLVRPVQGRYIAGVCAALGRATNTDPVLWRVVLVVLGLFGGVGVLIYLIGWLGIRAENDPVSPIESLFGRGKSGTSPLSVALLAVATVLTFVFVLHDGFRATLLIAAIAAGIFLLMRRNTPFPFGGSGPRPASA